MGATRIAIGTDRSVGPGEPALVVAEIGQNHNGSRELAEQLIDAAAWAGAGAIKLVKRDLESELSREAAARPYQSQHAFGPTYGEHRRALELSADDHRILCQRARRHGLLYLATACDIPSAKLLAPLGVDVYKIASRDLANLPLVNHLASSGRPIFVSTGMSTIAEIDAPVEVLRRRCCPFVLLQCTSLYPTPYDRVHLRSLTTLAVRYGVPVGFSDHTQGILLPPVAVAMGASVIEKHLTLDRGLKGTDHAGSLEPEELRQTVINIRLVETALGQAGKPVPEEVASVRAKLGRSLFTRAALAAGTEVSETMLALKCPGDGLSWLDRQLLVGRRLKRDMAADEKLSLEDVL